MSVKSVPAQPRIGILSTLTPVLLSTAMAYISPLPASVSDRFVVLSGRLSVVSCMAAPSGCTVCSP